MKFVADIMLGSLAKRLRLQGYDVLYDPSLSDNAVLQISLEQERIILTRDNGLAARPLARNSILIRSDDIREQLLQVERAFPASTAAALTRCSQCNALLEEAPREEIRDRVPPHVLETIVHFRHCPGCGRVYWEGSHVKRMNKKGEK